MLRRLASVRHTNGRGTPDDQEPMSPSPGDDVSHPETTKSASGGLASVFKGLAGGKLTKSSPPLQPPMATMTTVASQPSRDRFDVLPVTPVLRGLPQEHMEHFARLKTGQLNDRIAGANALRYAITDYPLNPIMEVWNAAKDLIDGDKPENARVAGWRLLTECVKDTSATDFERREYFRTLTAQTAHPDDFPLQLEALEYLTNRGRNVAGFYYDIFPLLTVWLANTFDAARLARRANKSAKGKTLVTVEDQSFSRLFALIRDVVKFNFKYASDAAVGRLMDNLLEICNRTSQEDDLAACISVIDAMVTFGSVPNGKLRDCIQVLSSIHCLVPSRQKDAWHTLSNICKSHHGQSTVRILLDVLRNAPAAPDKERDRDVIRDIRGALTVLKKLLGKSAEKGYPGVPLALLVDGLANVCTSSSSRVSTEILRLVNSLFDDGDGIINPLIAEEHWSPIFSVAAQCAAKSVPAALKDVDPSIPQSSAPKDDSEGGDNINYQLRTFINRVEKLLTEEKTDFFQREECMRFLAEVHHVLPDSAAALLLDHLKEFRSCYPSEVDWKKNLELVLEGIYLDRGRSAPTRIQALAMVMEIYDFLCLVRDLVEEESIFDLVKRVLSGMSVETDAVVLQETVTFMVRVAEIAGAEQFDFILDTFKNIVCKEADEPTPSTGIQKFNGAQQISNQPSEVGGQSLPNVVTKGYVQIFMKSMDVDALKAVKTFNALVHIAGSTTCETDARLTAMKLLFRLRADFEYRVYVTPHVENESIAASIYRTDASFARKAAEDAAHPPRLGRLDQAGFPRTPIRGASYTPGQTMERSGAIRPLQLPRQMPYQGQRLWSLPDPEALPELPRSTPSHLLFSYTEGADGEASTKASNAVLKMSSWLNIVLNIFHQGSDWEIYSFILAHLPAQLSDHPIFQDAIPQLQELRGHICEVIRTNRFQEPPLVSGLRRPDVANCLFHSLIMLVSYHQHFQKLDEDEIVRAFLHGIADKTAKTCIHGLSICCYELPLSVSKSLDMILTRMSQVITQPFVAMHLLEFLACLSRLPALYSNFRDEDYRVVFGICFRYLQYVRDKKHHARSTAHMSEPSTPNIIVSGSSDFLAQQAITDDLPQYVYALAYHVITFWFLAVKMPDRLGHISWIAKNLFTDVDGSASNEEQAQITLDFMQRVAFSDASDSAHDPLFNRENFGEIQQKRWIIGNSIVTVKQAKESGWAEITRRYPSGTSSYAVRVEFTPMTAQRTAESSDDAAWDGRFQMGTTLLPSHVFLQLLAPMPQMSDPAARPVPLPDEEAVDRAIRLFDRNSAVDGHKVGVIYIGDGQTDEVEILANTIGGPDYHEFLDGLGVLTRLKGANFNTQGLDREYGTDGEYTYCWRDRVSEIIFHVITQMPTDLERDPRCTAKKRHIGNDFVNIVFNDSGLPFKFDTFPSQFNYVYIVITPTPRHSFASARLMAKQREEEGRKAPTPFYMVQVMSQPGFPEISPAAEPKVVSLTALPTFVRLLALNASVFSQIWATREVGEHISPWRNRLREINRLRERYGPKSAQQQPNLSPPPNMLGAGGGGLGSSVVTSPLASGGQGGGITQQSLLGQDIGASRPVNAVRDSFTSLRRSSVATFFTNNSTADPTSHRSSMLSTTTPDTEVMFPAHGADALIESVDFSKWT
ncbi:uncharacterized protein B0T23DRAFT_435421 [Neurospora hispaniola]|uniref:Rap-GAP domain-containing protein n=1 Tax=Neurospora hispaniola TaxID=588809 RepID=A0AAJ0MVR5_9PEZI|nr:hypothetical protein B0T23DRAFT_435421 [Neurospora hispaniola]